MKNVMIRVAMTSDRSWYSNKLRHYQPPSIAAIFFGTRKCSYKISHGSFFLQYGRLDVREVKAESVRASVIEKFWDEDFIVRKSIR